MVENAHACWQKLVMNNKQELSEKMGFEIIEGFTLFIMPALLVRKGYARNTEGCSPSLPDSESSSTVLKKTKK
jgi:hypothetical protein